MNRILIFGGTSEGRILSEMCSKNNIKADISVATQSGAEFLSKSGSVKIIVGRKNFNDIKSLIENNFYRLVVDATHPYAVEITENVQKACADTDTELVRVVREKSSNYPETAEFFSNIDEIVEYLNSHSGNVLNTLGRKSLEKLREVNNFRERIWVRAIPSDNIAEYCKNLGYDVKKLILKMGASDFDENVTHIKKSGAEILLTKDSAGAGGFPEKMKAVEECGVKAVILKRPCENGLNLQQAFDYIKFVTEGD